MAARADPSGWQQAFADPAAHRHRVRPQEHGRIGDPDMPLPLVLVLLQLPSCGVVSAGVLFPWLRARRARTTAVRASKQVLPPVLPPCHLRPLFCGEKSPASRYFRHGPCRDRTCDLGIKSPLLYQLS